VAEGSELCLSCHHEVQEDFASANYQHPPVKEDCSRCHDAHSSDHPYQLRGGKELCLDCHQNVGELLANASLVHGAIDEEGGCHRCHSGHSSRFASLLKRPPLDSCLECHDRPVEAADGAILANIADQLAKNPYFHGPIRRADCSACHDPHASSNFRLLRHDYPRQFYLPEFNLESFGLCFQCHLPQLVQVERGSRITRFQDGDGNLHYTHVHREKSRTCRACHHEHASATPDHIRETFVFGGWLEAPVKFERLSDGGACTPACHKRKEYHRGTKEPVPVVK
jgi:predicted CXXCH cytochrome family protein